jgi:predicted component of type VI protein secretion system
MISAINPGDLIKLVKLHIM